LGRFVIPCPSVRVGLQRPQDMKAYLEHSQSEQRRIQDATRAGAACAPFSSRCSTRLARRSRYPRIALAAGAR
jgi:hypothetical protein